MITTLPVSAEVDGGSLALRPYFSCWPVARPDESD